MYVFVYHILYVCVCVYVFVCVCVCVCARARAHVYICVYLYMCVHIISSHCVSYNINSIFVCTIKCKTYFEVILINLDEAKFNESKQFEFGARAACYIV